MPVTTALRGILTHDAIVGDDTGMDSAPVPVTTALPGI